MKTVILAIGRRGAGKSTFTSLVKELYPNIGVIHWDRYFRDNFSDWDFDAYSSDGSIATEMLWEHIKNVLESHRRQPLILDSWWPTPESRSKAIARLCSLGANTVIAWHFITPAEICHRQFAQREFGHPGWDGSTFDDLVSIGRSDNSYFEPITPGEILLPTETNVTLDPRWDRDLFRFNGIRAINPHQLILPNMPLI